MRRIGVVVLIVVLVRRQWVENERLPFPIVQLQLALIEPPRRGRALNPLFRSWGFWIALATVFVLQGLSALHQYYPRHVPEVPLSYDLSGIFANARCDSRAASKAASMLGKMPGFAPAGSR